MAIFGKDAREAPRESFRDSLRDSPNDRSIMAKETDATQAPKDGVISIIGPGMRVDGDCFAEGTLRIEGHIKGTVRAGKAVVVSKDGVVEGDILTQDAIIGGKVTGTVIAESRLELQSTCLINGEIRARRIKLDEGGQLNGNVQSGERATGNGRRPDIPAQQPKPVAAPVSQGA